jgi:hypothetical protein
MGLIQNCHRIVPDPPNSDEVAVFTRPVAAPPLLSQERPITREDQDSVPAIYHGYSTISALRNGSNIM